jgi:hypothetical protein
VHCGAARRARLDVRASTPISIERCAIARQ